MTPDHQVIKDDASGKVVLRGYIAGRGAFVPWRELWVGFIDPDGHETTCIYRDATAAHLQSEALREALTNIRLKVRFLEADNEGLASSLAEIGQTIDAVLDQ